MDSRLHHSVHTLNIDSRRNSTSFVDENCGCLCMHRAVVPSSNIRPIDTSAQALAVKRTSGFVRACSELARHREMLASNTDDVSDEQDSPDVSAIIAHKVNTCLMLRLLCPCKTGDILPQSSNIAHKLSETVTSDITVSIATFKSRLKTALYNRAFLQ